MGGIYSLQSSSVKQLIEYGLNIEHWIKSIERAEEMLENGNLDGAKQCLSLYSNIIECKKISDGLIRDHFQFTAFKRAFESKDYATMYDMVSRVPSLKMSKPYLVVEKIWAQSIDSVLSLIIKGEAQKHKILTLLDLFASIPEKKPMVQMIVKNSEDFLRFKTAFAKKEYDIFFALVDKYNILTKFQEYSQMLEHGQYIVRRFMPAFLDCNYSRAKSIIKTLKYFQEHYYTTSHFEYLTEILHKFITYHQNRQFREFFILAEEDKELINTRLYRETVFMFDENVKKAEEFANEGCLDMLNDYIVLLFGIKKYQTQLKNILDKCFYNGLIRKIESEKMSFSIFTKILQEYICIFPDSTYIQSIIETIGLHKINKNKMDELKNILLANYLIDKPDFGRLSYSDLEEFMPNMFENLKSVV